jgi:pimeloyl-ACP methyl ester carboxylesterase
MVSHNMIPLLAGGLPGMPAGVGAKRALTSPAVMSAVGEAPDSGLLPKFHGGHVDFLPARSSSRQREEISKLKRTFLSLTAALAPIMAMAAFAQQADQPAQGTAMLPAPSKSGYAPVNGVEIYYAVYGKGDPLVLLHGGLATMDMFGPNVALLAQSHEVIAIDLQAHGHTLPFDRPMSYEAMADDVAGVIQYLGFEKADLMGYSLGGGTALRVAIQHPKLVDRLVVVSAPYAWAGWHDYNQQGMRSMTPDMAEGMKGTPLYESYAAVAPDAKNFPVLIEQVTAMMMHDFDWSAEIKGLKAPTLLIFADWDAVRTSHAASFFELLGGGLQDALWDGSGMNANRLAIIPNATHYNIFADTRPGETAIAFLDASAQ